MKRGYKVKREARSKRTEGLTQVLPRLFSSMGKDKEKTYRYQLLLNRWEDIVGETVAAHVRPVRMDFRKLFLAADAPVWANELRYMERQMIDKINAFVCDELVTSIAFCGESGIRRVRRRRRGAPQSGRPGLGAESGPAKEQDRG